MKGYFSLPLASFSLRRPGDIVKLVGRHIFEAGSDEAS